MTRYRITRVLPILAIGCGRVGFAPVGDGDLASGEFEIVDELDLGDLQMTVRGDVDGVALDPAAMTGTFTSRVFALPGSAWTAIAWEPDAPYGKAMPDLGHAESGYPTGNLDMAASIALLHLDDDPSTAVGPGTVLPDASGHNTDFTGVAAGGLGMPPGYVAGIIGNALRKGADLAFFHTIDAASELNFKSRAFTMALWVKSPTCTSDNSTYWGTESPTQMPHMWLGCCSTTGSIGGYFIGSSGPGTGNCTDNRSIVDDQWHHVAVVRSMVNAEVQYAMYLDGQPGSATLAVTDPDVTWPTGSRFGFTSFELTNFPNSVAVGIFDEAAIWTRALDDAELAALYARAATDLAIQYRFCNAPDCSDASFGAPLHDPATSLAAGARIPIGTDAHPYFQYRATFSTIRPGVVPALHRTRIRGLR